MLEFCLVLPIYLLIFGGTFMIFDLSMARLHLQESNRNIAWLQGDRYDAQKNIERKLYENAVEYFDIRNKLEQTMSDRSMWSFGELYQKYRSAEKNSNSGGKPGQTASPPWGGPDDMESFSENGVELNINQPWSGGITGSRLKNGFMLLHTGNMELTMDKVSATYIGAVGVSSVILDPKETSVPLYRQSYPLTRARGDDGKATKEKNASATMVNGESLLLRRNSDGEIREEEKTPNDISPLTGTDRPNVLVGSWPASGTIGNLTVFVDTSVLVTPNFPYRRLLWLFSGESPWDAFKTSISSLFSGASNDDKKFLSEMKDSLKTIIGIGN